MKTVKKTGKGKGKGKGKGVLYTFPSIYTSLSAATLPDKTYIDPFHVTLHNETEMTKIDKNPVGATHIRIPDIDTYCKLEWFMCATTHCCNNYDNAAAATMSNKSFNCNYSFDIRVVCEGPVPPFYSECMMALKRELFALINTPQFTEANHNDTELRRTLCEQLRNVCQDVMTDVVYKGDLDNGTGRMTNHGNRERVYSYAKIDSIEKDGRMHIIRDSTGKHKARDCEQI
jgi:hypothetical protein